MYVLLLGCLVRDEGARDLVTDGVADFAFIALADGDAQTLAGIEAEPGRCLEQMDGGHAVGE